MQSFLKVTKIDNRQDKNGRPFQSVTFNEIKFLPNGQEVITAKVRKRNLWSATDAIQGDNLYGKLAVGSMVDGSIVEFQTTAFEVEGRTVNKTTLVIFEGENPISYANGQLRQNGACVIDEHGQPTAKFDLTYKQAVETVATGVGSEEDELGF